MAAVHRARGGAFSDLYWSLVSLNHRGQQSYGIITYGGDGAFRVTKGLGPVPEAPPRGWGLGGKGRGSSGVAHVRYATSGGSSRRQLLLDAQPVVASDGGRSMALAYNGNVVNAAELRRGLESRGVQLHGTSDAEVLAHELLEGVDWGLVGAAKRLAGEVDGAYSIVGLMDDGTVFALRDPMGIKPLFMGISAGSVMFASETVALDVAGLAPSAVRPGELVAVSPDGRISRAYYYSAQGRERLCAFEYAYFARPDSVLDGRRYAYEVRRELGRRLAVRYGAVAERVDVVVPVPETAVDAAYGFHEASGKPMEPLVTRQRFFRLRAFMALGGERPSLLSKKYNLAAARVPGRRIALIDDSIIRGDTLRLLISGLRAAGAEEVHVFSTFPKVISPCFYGVDMATYGELIGFGRADGEVARELGADSVNYMERSDFEDVVGAGVCMACVDGLYPTPLALRLAGDARARAVAGGRLTEVLG